MLFNSWQYAVFLPLVVAAYWLLPHRARWALLLAASYYFYMSWNANLVVLILATTVTSYAAARAIAVSDTPQKKKIWLAFGICISMGMLFFFKYFNFFSSGVTALLRAFSLPVEDFTLQVMLPVGISFYTFQTVSYVIDVYRGKLEPERHFGLYALYVSFFPQLVAGPIERAANLLPQFHARHTPNPERFSWGLRSICLGLFKKVVLADFAAPYVDAVFNAPLSCGPMAYVVGALLFSVQIYGDFAGYSDIARGSAALLGFELMENFNAPYYARSIKEFWRRWHISLSAWFSDYVYIPLGGSRVKRGRHLVNLLVTLMLSGLWHGAKWTFVLWGAAHGLLLCADVFFLPWRERVTARLPRASRRIAACAETLVTYGLVVLLWIVFRANSMADVVTIFSRLPWALSAPVQGLQVALSTMGLTAAALLRLGLSLAALAAVDGVRRFRGEPFALLRQQRAPVRWAVSYALAFCVLLALFTRPEGVAVEFIYFQF